MSYTQSVAPNLEAIDGTGMCLRFVQRVYQNKNPYYYASAASAWQNAVHKRFDRKLPSVSVPVYFDHYGTYGSPPTYGNWGHIVAWVPWAFNGAGGFLSSPTTWAGRQWFSSIEAIERAFNASYVGWALDVGGLTVATTKPVPDTEENVNIFGGKSERSKPQVIGDKETYVTFLDDHGDSKWGDKTIARGPGKLIASNVTVLLEGDPGTRVALAIIRETGAGKNRYRYKRERVTIDTFGQAVAQLSLSASLEKEQLVRVLAQAQSGKTVTVREFMWDGAAQAAK